MSSLLVRENLGRLLLSSSCECAVIGMTNVVRRPFCGFWLGESGPRSQHEGVKMVGSRGVLSCGGAVDRFGYAVGK